MFYFPVAKEDLPKLCQGWMLRVRCESDIMLFGIIHFCGGDWTEQANVRFMLSCSTFCVSEEFLGMWKVTNR